MPDLALLVNLLQLAVKDGASVMGEVCTEFHGCPSSRGWRRSAPRKLPVEHELEVGRVSAPFGVV